MRKVIRYFGYVVRDMLTFTPVVFWGKFIANLLEGIMRVWQPILIAEIFELAPHLDNAASLKSFRQEIAFLILCIGIPVLCSLLLRIVRTYDDSKKEKYYGWKMFEYAQKIRLEALEDAGILDSFRKADASYSDFQAGHKLFTYVLMFTESCCVCAGTILVAAGFSPWLVPCAVLGFLPHLSGTMLAEKLRTRVYRGQISKRRRLQYLWKQFCTKESVKEMRTMGFGGYLKKLWIHTNMDVVREIQNVELKAVKISAIDRIIKNACYAVNVAVAILLMVRGELAVGQFAACLSAFTVLQNELMSLGYVIGELAAQYHCVEDYYDFFKIETEPEYAEESRPMDRNHSADARHFMGTNHSSKNHSMAAIPSMKEGPYTEISPSMDKKHSMGKNHPTGKNTSAVFQKDIILDDVHFRYRGSETEALNGINLKINKGEHVVIVGVNGSGKTTLSKILTGAYAPESGAVYYDGRNAANLKKAGLYGEISIVPQDFVHYNFSLRENICISNLKYREDDRRLQSVTDAVEMQELVQSIGGLDAPLGREFGGRELSGGEWQKVAIARGLFKDSSLIVLDEPTSALDPLVEYEILTKFLELARTRTSVIISHRVGICRTADKIVVMKDGSIVECGTHEELKNAGGEYSRIWTEQAKWY